MTSMNTSPIPSDDEDVECLGRRTMTEQEIEAHRPDWEKNHEVHYQSILADERRWREEAEELIAHLGPPE